MNLEAISSVLKKGSLVEVIIFVPGSKTLTMRFGRVASIIGNNLILFPHNDSLVEEYYGGDIIGNNTILDGNTIVEIIGLVSEPTTLKELIKKDKRIN